jgi:hypothetical protein
VCWFEAAPVVPPKVPVPFADVQRVGGHRAPSPPIDFFGIPRGVRPILVHALEPASLPGLKGSSSLQINWRQNPRFSLRVPLWIRPMDVPDAPSQPAETSNISASGLCLVSELPFQFASPVEILITMPREIVGESVKPWCCRGKVVRLGESHPQRGTRIVGVQFQYYDVLPEEGQEPESLQVELALRWRP